MALYTKKEYEKRNVKTSANHIYNEIEKMQEVKQNDKWFIFLHPDGHSINGAFILEQETLNIIDGMTKTKNIEVKQELIKRGFNYYGEKE